MFATALVFDYFVGDGMMTGRSNGCVAHAAVGSRTSPFRRHCGRARHTGDEEDLASCKKLTSHDSSSLIIENTDT